MHLLKVEAGYPSFLDKRSVALGGAGAVDSRIDVVRQVIDLSCQTHSVASRPVPRALYRVYFF
jgi:hypothetical protein